MIALIRTWMFLFCGASLFNACGEGPGAKKAPPVRPFAVHTAGHSPFPNDSVTFWVSADYVECLKDSMPCDCVHPQGEAALIMQMTDRAIELPFPVWYQPRLKLVNQSKAARGQLLRFEVENEDRFKEFILSGDTLIRTAQQHKPEHTYFRYTEPFFVGRYRKKIKTLVKGGTTNDYFDFWDIYTGVIGKINADELAKNLRANGRDPYSAFNFADSSTFICTDMRTNVIWNNSGLDSLIFLPGSDGMVIVYKRKHPLVRDPGLADALVENRRFLPAVDSFRWGRKD